MFVHESASYAELPRSFLVGLNRNNMKTACLAFLLENFQVAILGQGEGFSAFGVIAASYESLFGL